MASELNVNKTQILLNSFAFSNSLTDFWNEWCSAVIKTATLLLCGRDISSEIKNAFNLKNSVKSSLKKGHDHHNKVFLKLYNNDNVMVLVLGDYCSVLVLV